MIPLQLTDIKKSFRRKLVVDLSSLQVIEGEILALLGPSGCGKSTTLRLIAGLDEPDQGRIEIDGVVMAEDARCVAPDKRNVGLVFQDYALFPHLTVAENILYGLRRSSDRNRRLDEMIDLVGLDGFGSRYPRELSGGQQQRVALARALAPRPRLLLLDEPFSSLDQGLRHAIRSDVRRIIKKSGATAILVTHDQEEALSIADRIAVMLDGRIAQVDTPSAVYLQPATLEVATFMGEANVFEGMALSSGIKTPLGLFPNSDAKVGPVSVMVRPEHIQLSIDTNGVGVPGVVESVHYFGHDHMIVVGLEGVVQPVQVRLLRHVAVQPGETVFLSYVGPVVIYPREHIGSTPPAGVPSQR